MGAILSGKKPVAPAMKSVFPSKVSATVFIRFSGIPEASSDIALKAREEVSAN